MPHTGSRGDAISGRYGGGKPNQIASTRVLDGRGHIISTSDRREHKEQEDKKTIKYM